MKILSLLLILSLPLLGKDSKFTQTFRCPPDILQLMQSKYEGATLEELFSNAGADIEHDDKIVFSKQRSTLSVRAEKSDLTIIAEIINALTMRVPAQRHLESIKTILTSNDWDFNHLRLEHQIIGTIKFNLNGKAEGSNGQRTTHYRWAVTKQGIIEIRKHTGELLMTALLLNFGVINKQGITSYTNRLSIEYLSPNPQLKVVINTENKANKSQ